MLEKMFAESVAHQIVLLQLIERFVQISGELVDPEMASFAMAHCEDVLVDRRSGIDVLFDAVQAGAQHDGKGEIRVARGIWHPELDTRGGASRRRNANERAPIFLRPRDV